MPEETQELEKPNETTTETQTEIAPAVSETVSEGDGESTEDSPEVSFGDFEALRHNVDKEHVKVEVAKAAAEPQKTEPQKPAEPAKVKTQLPERDYTGIPEEDKETFRRMPRESFDKLKPLYLEHGKFKAEIDGLKQQLAEASKKSPNALPDAYYSHPEAYKLDPEYNNAVAAVNTANWCAGFWKEQLVKISKGEPYQLLDTNDKGQIIILPDKLEPSEAGRIDIEEYLSGSRQALARWQEKSQQLQQNFGKIHAEDVGLLKEGEQKFFPDYDKPDHWSKPIQEEFIKKMPASQRNNVLLPILAKTVANNAKFSNTVKTLTEENAKLKEQLKTKTATTNGQQPSKNKFVTSGAEKQSNDWSDVSYADFDRMRHAGV